jgi:lipopolysaccharide assembly outer membrane protein LptD (OstA)
VLFNPIQSLELKGDMLWDHQRDRVTKSAISASVPFKAFGQRQDSVQLSYQSEREIIRTISLNLYLSLPYGFQTGTSWSRDLKANENVNASYWLGYKHQCYGIKLVVDTAQKTTQWGIFIELLGIGELGGKL